jgi:hypothetical protein
MPVARDPVFFKVTEYAIASPKYSKGIAFAHDALTGRGDVNTNFAMEYDCLCSENSRTYLDCSYQQRNLFCSVRSYELF